MPFWSDFQVENALQFGKHDTICNGCTCFLHGWGTLGLTLCESRTNRTCFLKKKKRQNILAEKIKKEVEEIRKRGLFHIKKRAGCGALWKMSNRNPKMKIDLVVTSKAVIYIRDQDHNQMKAGWTNPLPLTHTHQHQLATSL